MRGLYGSQRIVYCYKRVYGVFQRFETPPGHHQGNEKGARKRPIRSLSWPALLGQHDWIVEAERLRRLRRVPRLEVELRDLLRAHVFDLVAPEPARPVFQ